MMLPRRFPGLPSVAALAAVAMLVACGGQGAEAPDAPVDPDRLPDGFDESELMALASNLDVIKTVENDVDLEVLQWKIEENSAGRTTSALIWVRFLAGDREDWMLAHAIRAAGPDGPASPWALAVYRDTPQVSHEYYDRPPGAEEVFRFKRATWWRDDATSGNRLVDAAVRRAAWTQAIGTPPPPAGG